MKLRLAPLALLLCGCHDWGPEQTETARVVQLTHIPSTRSVEFILVPHVKPGGGVETRLEPTMTGHRAYHIVEFECPHGRFTVDREEVWSRLHEGDMATVTYREDRKAPGVFDFVDAWPERRPAER